MAVQTMVCLKDLEMAKDFVSVVSEFEEDVMYGYGNTGVDAKCLDDVLYRGINRDTGVVLMNCDDNDEIGIRFLSKLVEFI